MGDIIGHNKMGDEEDSSGSNNGDSGRSKINFCKQIKTCSNIQ